MGLLLEVEADVGEEGAGVGRVERILRDVGEAYIVACFHIEHVEHHTAA